MPDSGVSSERSPIPASRADIAFACIAPHGGLAIPEACSPEEAGLAAATQAGMAELARRLGTAEPDVVIVLTPHGIHVDGHIAVAVGGRAAGALEETPAVSLDVPVDRELALSILRELAAVKVPAVGVSYGSNDPAAAVMPMDWGSLIPLWYLGGRRNPPLHVVLVAPARDLTPEHHLAAGAAIARAAMPAGRRAAIVASADQAHTHAADGPYGYDPGARVHDALVVSILRDGRLGRLLDIDPALIGAAKPDSWWQMVMLLGAIGTDWRPVLLSYEAPTYFGTLCAAFEPVSGA